MSNNNFLTKVKGFFARFKKLNNKDLANVSGAGNEPEEFDWKPKGYETPVKEQDENNDWVFNPVGDQDKKDIFKK